MCSTPRPKRVMKSSSTGATISGTILSGLSAQERATFVQKANQADDRRQELQQKAAVKKREKLRNTHAINSSLSIPQIKVTKKWNYWLIDASLKEIFMLIFLGRSY